LVRKLAAFGVAVVLLLLQGCYKTDLPAIGYRYGVPVPELHIVHRGETLFSIGKRYSVGHHKLIKFNHIRSPYTIFVGQRIYLTHAAPKASRSFIPKRHLQRHYKAHPKSVVAKHQRKRADKQKKKHLHRVHHKAAADSPFRRHSSAHHRAVATVPLLWPASGPVTSGFGSRGSRMHDGIDIGAKLGSAVIAVAAGTVVYSDHRLSGYGNLIIIRHRKNLFTAYAHNQKNLVHQGDKVRAGQKIARIGDTGRSTGPHLHFEVRRGTTPVDPLLYLPKR